MKFKCLFFFSLLLLISFSSCGGDDEVIVEPQEMTDDDSAEDDEGGDNDPTRTLTCPENREITYELIGMIYILVGNLVLGLIALKLNTLHI